MKRALSLLALSLVLTWGGSSSPVLAGGEEKVELDGYAEWHRDGEPDLFIVEGQRVRVHDSVDFKGEGFAFTIDQIPLGYEMQVKGVRLADGSILARELRAKPNGNAFMEGTLRSSFDELEAQFRHHGRVTMSERNYGELWEAGDEVERVRSITARLIPPYLSLQDFRVYVVDNPEWNAMAAPNGSIYVFRGLLDDMDDDEVAIVLGHELAHVSHEHSRRQFKRNLIFSAISTGLFAAADHIDNDAARIAAKGATAAGTLVWTNGYGRSREDQADRVGLRYAYEGGFDVTKGPGLWKRFGEKYGGMPKAVNFFLGSHSVAADRAANLELELARNYSAD